MVVMPNAAAGSDVEAVCKVLISLWQVVELLQAAPRGVVRPAQLLRAIEEFLELFHATFGPRRMVSTFHALLHLADELERFKAMLTCWVHERKHRMVREWCDGMKNTTQFERWVMSNVVCQHLHALRDPDKFLVSVGLVNPRDAPKVFAKVVRDDFDLPATADVYTARVSRYNEWGVCATGDCVMVNGSHGALQAGWVWKHAAFQDVGSTRAVSLVQLGDQLEHNPKGRYATWSLRSSPEWICTADIVDTVIFTWDDESTLRSVLPLHLV